MNDDTRLVSETIGNYEGLYRAAEAAASEAAGANDNAVDFYADLADRLEEIVEADRELFTYSATEKCDFHLVDYTALAEEYRWEGYR